MLIPIVCLTCGFPLGDVEDLYLAMKTERVRETLRARNTDAAFALVDPGLQIDCADILDLLGVTNRCCRGCLISSMRFEDLYD